MSTKLFLSGIIMVLLAASCSEDTFNLVGKEDLLINTWLDPYESNCEGDNMFFRREGSGRIPPGERNKLEIFADGRAHYVIFSPRDPHRYDFVTDITGSWRFGPDERILEIFNSSGKIKFTFNIHSIAKDELVLSYTENRALDLPK